MASLSKKYRLQIAYDGTRYNGWQVQPSGVSIQGIIEAKLGILLKQEIRIIGAGRTDAGVHAIAQVAHFTYPHPTDCYELQHALNGMLPSDIRIKELNETLVSFHAQHAALSKEYHYHLWLEKTLWPFLHLYRHHFCYNRFSLSRLKEAASYFIGTHDFASFANIGSSAKHTVRTLMRLDIKEQEGGVRLEFEGDGFLYKMVRNIVGTLLEVSIGKRNPCDIHELLLAKDRRLTGAAAPAKGLFLVKINYPTCF